MKSKLDGLEKRLNTYVESILVNYAKATLDEMKKDAPKDEKRLHDSLTYASIQHKPRPEGKAQSGDEVPDVNEENTVVLGTRVPYGIYVDKGTGKHRTDNQKEDFELSITDWGRRHGFDEQGIYFLKKKIRENGTIAQPFFEHNAINLMNKKGEMARIILDKIKSLFFEVNKDKDSFKKVEVHIKL